MKCLTIYVHRGFQGGLVDCLRSSAAVEGFTVAPCSGHSPSTSREPFAAARDLVVGYVPRVRVDIVLEDGQVAAVLEHVRTHLGSGGAAGMWFVTDVLDHGRL